MAHGCSLIHQARASTTLRWPRSSASPSKSLPWHCRSIGSEHAQTRQVRRCLIQTFGQLWQMACGYGWKHVVLYVKEHVVGGTVFEHAAQRSGERPWLIAIVVDGPDGKERCKTLPCRHRQNVISKPWDCNDASSQHQGSGCNKFGDDPAETCAAGPLPGIHMQPN